MSAEIIMMPLSAEKAWEVYQRLVLERNADPALLADRKHCEATIRAWVAFEQSFKREGCL